MAEEDMLTQQMECALRCGSKWLLTNHTLQGAAEQGDAEAQFELANMHFAGLEGFERNVLMAGRWIDKALATNYDDDAMIRKHMLNMQTFLLAERLRRAKNVPLTQEIIPFKFKPLPTDVLEKDDVSNETHTYNVSCEVCEVCAAAVTVDGGKKYCPRCRVTVYCSRACQKAD